MHYYVLVSFLVAKMVLDQEISYLFLRIYNHNILAVELYFIVNFLSQSWTKDYLSHRSYPLIYIISLVLSDTIKFLLTSSFLPSYLYSYCLACKEKQISHSFILSSMCFIMQSLFQESFIAGYTTSQLSSKWHQQNFEAKLLNFMKLKILSLWYLFKKSFELYHSW